MDHRAEVERLSAIDASFLYAERNSGHTHIGAIATFAGEGPAIGELRDHVAARLELVPRFRQRLHHPWPLARPIWIDDHDFDVDYHVQPAPLAAGSGKDGLRGFAERIFSQRLDRSKPLWEMWLVDGFEEGRFALMSKIHHAVLDGVSGVGVAAAILDFEASVPDLQTVSWRPRRAPSAAEAAADEARAFATAIRGDGSTDSALLRPRAAFGFLSRCASAAAELATLTLTAQPREPFDRAIDPHRRFVSVSRDLAELNAVRKVLGGTLNDVFVAAVAGGLGNWLRRQHIDTFGWRPRALVPVSMRGDDEQAAMGNRLAAMVVALPVEIRDPRARLDVVREALEYTKASSQTTSAETIARVEELAPAPLLALTSRLHFSNRLYSVLVSNVRGPQLPLYLMGRRLDEIAPVPFLAPGKALSIAILSYDGVATVGLMSDRAEGELDSLRADLSEALDELVVAAGRRPRRRLRRRTGRFRPDPEAAPEVEPERVEGEA